MFFFSEQISNQFEELTNNITVKVDNEGNILAKREEQFANQFKELTNNITVKMETERDILAKLKESIIQPSVAFHVHNVNDLVLDTNNEVLVFESIITNEGSGYDKSTGIFTAPIEGTYFFTVHVCTANSKYSPIGLVLDSTFVARSINFDKDTYTCGSVSAIVKIKSGGQVWVASTNYDTGFVLSGENIYITNTFSGMLISK
ncbi:complement C1q-like protein 2 isoform X3 [Ruditapes philippinarum]|uniref:complement C1q-like protein 2 isoform X3 n=1 Tax=Ruditapes philippinarum TaxID=129788 RepID=UPI00295B26E7|nr:complement C1q-like protein 2 isoform X3 [Ruditapes philippinarum]